MNRIFMLLSMVILLNISCIDKNNESGMKVQIIITNKIDSKGYETERGDFYSINIDLVNNTDSMVSFWVMSCSWQDNWIFSVDTISLYSQGCDKNYPIIKRIEPRQKLTYNGVIHSRDCTELDKETEIRLGFVLIKEHDILKMSDFRNVLIKKIQEQKDIIWSEHFKIDK